MPRRKKNPAVIAGRRSTTSGSEARASQQLVGKRKADELASSGDSMELDHRRPEPSAGPALLPANSSARADKLLTAAGNPDYPGEG